MAVYENSTPKQRRAQRVLNWLRRKAIRMGIRNKDFVTTRRRFEAGGQFKTK